jgi:hypothetical protein
MVPESVAGFWLGLLQGVCPGVEYFVAFTDRLLVNKLESML